MQGLNVKIILKWEECLQDGLEYDKILHIFIKSERIAKVKTR